MEVKIGVIYTAKELVVESVDEPDAVRSAIDDALAQSEPVLWLTDEKGRRVGIPTDKIAYVEIGSDADARPVGFGRR
jgi:hypothetical protein